MIGSTRMPSLPLPPSGAAVAAEPEPEDRLLDEFESLIAWEFLMCLDLGFSIEQSTALVAVRNFTWHEAERLLKERGYPHATVVDELT